MSRHIIAFLLMVAYGTSAAAAPSELLVRSCLSGRPAKPSVSVHDLSTSEVIEEDNYAEGFDASYFFKYRGRDVGYAESKLDSAIIFEGKLYRLPSAEVLGDEHDSKPSSFTPSLANWSIVEDGAQSYLCVSFNFGGLGQSGDFQKVHGGYLLDTRTKKLFFAVRYIGPGSP